MIRAGDFVEFVPAYREDNFTFIAIDDEDKGRVSVMPVDSGLPIPPVQTVSTTLIFKKGEK